jgi:DNA-3-methyladenine glycosylase II
MPPKLRFPMNQYIGNSVLKQKSEGQGSFMSVAAAYLRKIDPVLDALIGRVGPCGLKAENRRSPYEALVRAIAHQQLHGRAAEAILGRFIALYPGQSFPEPALVLATEDSVLRACGFSVSKVAALRDICAKTLDGTVPSRRACARLDDGELIERLTSLRGVGRWTVEMLLIFTLGRPDVLPVDDFGVREGYRLIHALPSQPKPRQLAAIGEAWAPHRSTAAWYLWRASDEGKKAGLKGASLA